MEITEKQLLTVNQLATIINVHKQTIYTWIRIYGMPVIRKSNTKKSHIRIDYNIFLKWWKSPK